MLRRWVLKPCSGGAFFETGEGRIDPAPFFWLIRVRRLSFGVRIRAWLINNLDAGFLPYAEFINSLYQRDPHQCHHHTEGQGADHHSHLNCL
jgi:hypothetical protein